MKAIGFSSGVTGRDSNVDRMVKAILNGSSGDTEFVKLTDLSYSGCKGCVQLCAEPQICLLKDDLSIYYQKIKDADAVVVGSPVYMGDVNAAMAGFIERFFGYRHVTLALQQKPFILVVCGHRDATAVVNKFRKRLEPFRVEVLDTVQYVSESPPCLRCGRHQECSIGGLYGMLGNVAHSVTVTPDLFHKWEDDPQTVKNVEHASAVLTDL
jgi:hypothetical protein